MISHAVYRAEPDDSIKVDYLPDDDWIEVEVRRAFTLHLSVDQAMELRNEIDAALPTPKLRSLLPTPKLRSL